MNAPDSASPRSPVPGVRDLGADRRRTVATRTASAVVVLVALVLRLIGLEAESVWFDEGHTLIVTRMSTSDAVAALARDVHPPLYFLALAAWIRAFGASDAAMRSLSVLFGVVAVAGMVALGRRLGGTRAGLAAGLFAAVSPYFVAYSHEIRPYALLLALSVLSTLALLRLAERPASTTRRAIYALALASLPYTHAVGVFVGLAQALWVLVRVARPRPGDPPGLLRAALLCGGVALALFAPWIPTFLRQEESVRTTGWIARPGWKEFHRAVLAHAGGELAFAALAALALCGLGLAPRRPGPDRPRLVAGLLFVVPLLAPVAVSLVGPAIFISRTAIVSGAGLMLLAGLGAGRIAAFDEGVRPGTRRWRGVVSLAIVGAALAFSGRTLAMHTRTSKNTEFREAIALIEARARPGDVVVVGHAFERAIAEHYLRRRDLAIAGVSDAPPPAARSLWIIVTLHTRKHRRTEAELAGFGLRPVTVDRLHRVELLRYDR